MSGGSSPAAGPQGRFDLTGHVAVVTGGARGIGAAITHGLAQHGAAVLIADVEAERGESTAQTLRQEGLAVQAVPTDVTDPIAVESAFEAAQERLGGFDILVNNAGASQRTPAEEYRDEDLERMVRLNLSAVFFTMREAARRWIRTRTPGRIVNLGSFASIVADPLSAPYAATKGAVLQLTRTCAVEWAPHGIRVNAIGPGYTRTDMTRGALDDPETHQRILDRTPLGRVAEPEEMAGAVVFLASDASSYVTGHLLMIDGGWTAL